MCSDVQYVSPESACGLVIHAASGTDRRRCDMFPMDYSPVGGGVVSVGNRTTGNPPVDATPAASEVVCRWPKIR